MRIISAAVALLWLQSTPAIAADACTSQIPATLQIALEKGYPDYRPPLATDNLHEDVSYDLQRGGKGCLGFATADFDGDDKLDAIVAVSAKKGDAGIVVIAIAAGSTWTIHELTRPQTGRSRLYVGAGKPDRYDRTKSLDGPLAKGEAVSLVCAHSVAIYGATEGSGVAYCLVSGAWQHVWISD